LETCVKNCGKPFQTVVCQKDYVTDLVQLDCNHTTKTKVHMELKKKGVTFPPPSDQELLLVTHSHPASPARPNIHSSLVPLHGPVPHVGQEDSGVLTRIELERKRVSTVARLTEDQVDKLKRDLEITQGNLDIFNELLTELKPGEEHPEDKKLLNEVSKSCREMQARVLDLLGVVENRELTSILLDLNDNMNNQLLRFERYNNNYNEKRPKENVTLSMDDILLEVPSGVEPETHVLPVLKFSNKDSDFEEVDLQCEETHQKPETRLAGEDPKTAVERTDQ